LRKTLLRLGRANAPGLVVLLLAACSSNTIDVARRANFTSASTGAPFIVLLTDEQQSDPDTVRDASFLVRQLEADGLAAADKTADARYAVMLEPGRVTQTGDETASTQSDSQGGGGFGGGGGRGMGGGGFGGHHGGHGFGQSRSAPEPGVLRIAIFDLTKPRSPKERVFYAEVRAPRDRRQSEEVVDAMIAAALKNFPGKTRESYSEPLPARTGGEAG
jgi:hypothetical protein